MKTGFKKLDKMLGGGINEGEVTIIAGRPAKYKKLWHLILLMVLRKIFIAQ